MFTKELGNKATHELFRNAIILANVVYKQSDSLESERKFSKLFVTCYHHFHESFW